MKAACYTSPLDPMKNAPRTHRHLLLSAVLFLLSAQLSAQAPKPDFDPGLQRFAEAVFSKAGNPSLVAVQYEDKTGGGASTVEVLKRAVNHYLEHNRMKVMKPERALAEFRFTLSQNRRGYLWVAQILQGQSSSTMMLELPRSQAAATANTPSVVLRAQKIFHAKSEEALLDFHVVRESSLLLLYSGRLEVYRWENSAWVADGSQRLAVPPRPSRDPRGRLMIDGQTLQVFLAGVRCSGDRHGRALISCAASDDPWTISETPLASGFFASSRNFFTGAVTTERGAATLPQFFDLAGITGGQWAASGIDGALRVYSDFQQRPRSFNGWGSTLSSIRSNCGPEYFLMTRPRSLREPDLLVAVSFANEPALASPALESNASIVLLARNQENTRMITRDPMTGEYEASLVVAECR